MGNMKTAYLFAGQGAQFAGMGKDLYESSEECKTLFERANEILGFDIATLCFNGPEAELTKTEICQPAIFLVSTACFKAYRYLKQDDDIAGFAGLSLGEWSALHAAGAISFEDCLRSLAARGRFMQETCDAAPGAMLSLIGMDNDKIEELARATQLDIANLNAPGQTVLSGTVEGIDKAEKLAKGMGAKRAIKLNVAGAYHSELMKPAAEKLREFIKDIEFATPEFTVFSNVTGKPHTAPEDIKDALVSQVTSSVDWISCVQGLTGLGAQRMIEFGPGKVLSGLLKRIAPDIVMENVQDMPSLERI